MLEEDDVSIPSSIQPFKDTQSMDTSSLSSVDSILTEKPKRKERYVFNIQIQSTSGCKVG